MGRRWLAPGLWAIVVLLSSSMPIPAVDAPGGTDKGVHLVLYFVLGFLSGRALLLGKNARVWQLLVLVFGLLVFGALDELHQLWIHGRTASGADWVADAVGSIAGIAASVVVTRGRARRAA